MIKQNKQDKIKSNIKKIDGMTYEIEVYFNQNSTETLNDKLKRVLKSESEHQNSLKND